MGAKLAITTPGNIPHPLFPYESMGDAVAAIEKAVNGRLLHIEEHGVTIITGPGTIYKAVDDTWEDPPDNPQDPFYLILQTPHGAQLPPFGFHTQGAALKAIERLSYRGFVCLPGRPPEKEVTYIQAAPGMLALISSKEAFDVRIRQARAADRSNSAASSSPRIIIPK